MQRLVGDTHTNAANKYVMINFNNYESIRNKVMDSEEQINNNYNHTEGRNTFFTQANPYKSGYIDLQAIKNVFLTSTNLNNFHTLGPGGERVILKKYQLTRGTMR